MMMKAAPVTPLVMTESEFGFQLLVIALDHPASFGMGHQFLEGHFLGQCAQPAVSRLGLSHWPLNQQPFTWSELHAGLQSACIPGSLATAGVSGKETALR